MIRRSFAVLCALSLLSAQVQAASFSVTNTNGDTSAGSLGAAVAGSAGSGAAVSDTIGFGAGLNNVSITVPYSPVVKNSGVALGITAPSGGLLLDGGAGTILDFSGGGTLNLSNVSFTNGTLKVTDSTLAGSTILSGGVLQADGSTVQGTLALANAPGTILVGAGKTAGVTAAISGSQALTIDGGGTVSLQSANASTGGTTVTGGSALQVSDDSALGGAGAGVTLDNGTLLASGGITSARQLTLGSGAGVINTGGNAVTLDGKVTGSGGLAVHGSGGLILTDAANDYAGGTTVGSGASLFVGDDHQLGTGNVALDGGALNTTTGITTSKTLSLTADSVLAVDPGQTTAWSGAINGAHQLTLLGGAFDFTGSAGNSMNGVLVQSSALKVSDGSQLGAGTVTLDDGTLNTTTGIASADTISVQSSGGTISVDAGHTTTLTGDIGATALTVSGGGTVDVAFGRLVAEDVFVTSGSTLRGFGTLGLVQDIHLNDGTLSASGTVFTNRALHLDGAGTLSVDAGQTLFWLSGAAPTISGSGALTVTGGGTLDLTGLQFSDNTLQDGVAVTGGATVKINLQHQLGDPGGGGPNGGILTLDDGALDVTTGVSSLWTTVLAGAGTVKVDAGHTQNLSDVRGAGLLTLDGGGTFVLGASSRTGGTTVTGGSTASVLGDSSLGASGDVTLDNGTLKTTGGVTSARRFTLANGATVNVQSASSVLSGQVTGSGGLTVTGGSGSLTLANGAHTNDYTGGTTVSGGATLSVDADDELGGAAGGLTLDHGTLKTTAGVASARQLTLANGAAVNVQSANSTLGGKVTGSGGLTVTGGSGTLALSNAAHTNDYSGGTTVSGGATVSVDADDELGAAAGGVTLDNGTLKTTASMSSSRAVTLGAGGAGLDVAAGTLTLDGSLSGTGALTKSGAGTLSLAGAGGPGVDVAVSAGTLDFAQSADLTYAGQLSGSGAMSKSGSRTLTLSGDNSGLAGGLTVNDGVVQVSAANNLASGALTLDGGTLRTTADLTATNAVSLANGSGIDTGVNHLTLTGDLSGAASLTKSGAGTLTLAGSTLHSGGTDVSAGTLELAQAADAAYNGAITGGGAVAKSGAGTLTLGGVNDFTGGLSLLGGTVSAAAAGALGAGGLVFDGGALRTTATMAVANAVTLAGAGAWDVTSGVTTASGLVSGSGTLTKTGAGTLSLTGTSARTGDTAISGGVLELAPGAGMSDAGAISGAGTLRKSGSATLSLTGDLSGLTGALDVSAGVLNVDGNSQTLSAAVAGAGILRQSANTLTLTGDVSGLTGTLNAAGGVTDLNGAADQTLSAAVTGAGTLRKSGASTLTLSGDLSGFTGVVDVAAGTLDVDNASALALSNAFGGAGTLAKSGAGTLTLSGPVTTGGVAVNAGALAAAVAADTAWSTALSGSGAFAKTGAGTLTLSNANTLSGLSTIQQGELAITGSLAGAVAVNSGATLSGSGRVGAVSNSGTVKNGLTVDGNYAAGASGVFSVDTGRLALDVLGDSFLDGTLLVTNRPATGRYTVLITTGAQMGAFSTVSAAQSGVRITAIYDLHDVILDIISGTTFGQLPNLTAAQSRMAAVVDLLSQTASADLQPVLDRLSNLPAADLQKALDQMSPAAFGGVLGSMGFAGSGAHAGAVEQRLVGLRDGTADGGQAVLLLASAPGDWERYPVKKEPASRWGVFASGLGAFGRLDSRTDSNGSTPGYSFATGGAAVGVDYRFGENLIGGVTSGFTSNSSQIVDGGGAVTGQAVRYGAYGTVFDDDMNASLYLGGATDSYDSTRNIAPLGLTARSKPGAQELNVDGTVGWDPESLTLAGARVSPFAGLAYDRVMTRAFSETGAGPLDLNVDGFTAQSLRSTLGVKLWRKLKARGRTVTPFVSAAWRHEYQDQSRAIDAQFSTGGSFTTRTADAARDGAAAGAGLDAELGRGWSAKLAYNGDFRDGFTAHTVDGELRLKF